MEHILGWLDELSISKIQDGGQIFIVGQFQLSEYETTLVIYVLWCERSRCWIAWWTTVTGTVMGLYGGREGQL